MQVQQDHDSGQRRFGLCKAFSADYSVKNLPANATADDSQFDKFMEGVAEKEDGLGIELATKQSEFEGTMGKLREEQEALQKEVRAPNLLHIHVCHASAT